jgi:hypothetical protein
MSEVRTRSVTGGEKNAKEEQAHHIPWQGLRELYRVGTMGSEKYADYNFRKGFPWSLSYDAAHRHLNLWWDGEGFYEEQVEKTGKWWRIHHLANAAWHCLVLLFFEVTGKYDQFDDRPWVSDIKRQVKEAYDEHRTTDNATAGRFDDGRTPWETPEGS